MADITAYSGWIGHRNIGDEALYLATQKLFPGIQLSDVNYVSEYRNIIFGGGTTLPHYVVAEPDQVTGIKVGIGVGARSPEFWNRKFAKIDVDYYLGRINKDHLLKGKYANYVSYPFRVCSNHINFSSHYIPKSDFDNVREFDFDYLGVRGPQTRNILSEYGIESKVVGDTALALEPSSYHHEPQYRIAIIFRSGGHQWSTDRSYIDTVLDLCDSYSDTYEFLFIPFHPDDIGINMSASSKVSNSTFCDYCSSVSVNRVIDELSQCDLVIADRLHANILSACTYTPFISLEYRPKNRDFVQSIEYEEYNIKTSEITQKGLENKVKNALYDESNIDHLRENVTEKRKTLEGFSGKISPYLHT